MSLPVGAVLGVLSAVAASAYGLSASWSAFSSQPYTSTDLGLYWSSIGIIFGVTGATIGVASRHITKLRGKGAA